MACSRPRRNGRSIPPTGATFMPSKIGVRRSLDFVRERPCAERTRECFCDYDYFLTSLASISLERRRTTLAVPVCSMIGALSPGYDSAVKSLPDACGLEQVICCDRENERRWRRERFLFGRRAQRGPHCRVAELNDAGRGLHRGKQLRTKCTIHRLEEQLTGRVLKTGFLGDKIGERSPSEGRNIVRGAFPAAVWPSLVFKPGSFTGPFRSGVCRQVANSKGSATCRR